MVSVETTVNKMVKNPPAHDKARFQFIGINQFEGQESPDFYNNNFELESEDDMN